MDVEQQPLVDIIRSDLQILASNVVVILERWKLKQIMENIGKLEYNIDLLKNMKILRFFIAIEVTRPLMRTTVR